MYGKWVIVNSTLGVFLLLTQLLIGQISGKQRQVLLLSTNSPFYELSGQVTKQNFALDSAVVYLYREQIQGTVELVDSVQTFGKGGKYVFDRMISGAYYIMAKPYTSKADAINTYYGGSPVWIRSKAILLRQDMLQRNIDLLAENYTKGVARVSGTIKYGDTDLHHNYGEPAAYVPVVLMLNNQVYKRTYTNSKGFYQFNNVLLSQFDLIVDMPGKSTSGKEIRFTSSYKNASGTDFIVEESTVEETSFTGVQDFGEVRTTTLYPNPCKNRLAINSDNHWKELSIIDFTGKEQLNTEYEQGKELNIEQLEKGMYFLILKNGTEQYVMRFTKQ